MSATVTSRRFDELTAREFHDLAQLRSAVFVVEQNCVYLDLDGRDVEAGTEHHWIDDGGKPVCSARTLAEPGGAVRIGRVVTARSARGQGLARTLIGELVERFPNTVLEAQSYLAAWYGDFGFEIVGDEYLEDGIPHVPMRRDRG